MNRPSVPPIRLTLSVRHKRFHQPIRIVGSFLFILENKINCWVKLTSPFVLRDPFTQAWNKNIWLWHVSHRSQDIEHYRFTKLARYKFQPDRELMRSHNILITEFLVYFENRKIR